MNKTPWHLWAIGLVALVFYGLGCLDYAMTQIQGDAWLAKMDPTELQMAYFHAMPAWTDAAWAIAVWGALAGAILLLVRRKWAFHAFVISFLGWAASAVYAFALSNGMEAMGPWWPMQIVHAAVGLFFIWYSRMMTARGVLA